MMSAAFSRMSRHVLRLRFRFVSVGCSHRLSYSIITSVFVPPEIVGAVRNVPGGFQTIAQRGTQLLAGKLKVCPSASENGGAPVTRFTRQSFTSATLTCRNGSEGSRISFQNS